MKSIKALTNTITSYWDTDLLITKNSNPQKEYEAYCLCVRDEQVLDRENMYFGSLELTLNDFERYIESLNEATE